MKLNNFEKENNLDFKDKKLLQRAFIHRSYLNEGGRGLEHNERLEFLGDAVLELAATDFLFHKFPEKTEGELTSYRSALVNTDSLHKASLRIGADKYLLLSKGEKESKKGRGHLLANLFEAITGAIYLDKGYEEAEKFLKENLFDYIDEIIKKKLYKDPKSYFQEKAQEVFKITPEYKIIGEEGPDHDKVFISGLYLKNKKICEGRGSSKQKAEVEAAKKGLEINKWIS